MGGTEWQQPQTAHEVQRAQHIQLKMGYMSSISLLHHDQPHSVSHDTRELFLNIVKFFLATIGHGLTAATSASESVDSQSRLFTEAELL